MSNWGLIVPLDLVEDVAAEVQRARAKFPSATNLNVALMEEVGELARAQLHGDVIEGRKEAVQVIGLVVRILTEGDQSLTMTDESKQK